MPRQGSGAVGKRSIGEQWADLAAWDDLHRTAAGFVPLTALLGDHALPCARILRYTSHAGLERIALCSGRGVIATRGGSTVRNITGTGALSDGALS